MEKIKKYDKFNRLSVNLNFIFGIYSFYKYDSKKVYEITLSKLEDKLLYKELSAKNTKVIQIIDKEKILFSNKKEGKFKEHIYNTALNTIKTKTEIEFDNGGKVILNDYLDKEGKFSRDLTFNIQKDKIYGKGKN